MASLKRKTLGKEFFDRNSVVVARELIGKYIVRKHLGKEESYKIIETEAYEGFEDKASHAYKGKTPRNTPMFDKAGTLYVYLTYGLHQMLNIVCGNVDHPAAVLIRGIEGCSGPGRLTKKLCIDKTLNHVMLGKKQGLWIEERETVPMKIIKTPRIGIDYAGDVWSKKLYRFVLSSM